jgi:DNA-binding CsgD family transcriptional regulator
MGKTVGYNWTDNKINTEIAKELNISPVLDKIQKKLVTAYKQNSP